MRYFGICLLLILTSATSFGEVPESILGTWHFDLVRTMGEHIDHIAQAQPDVISPDAAEAQKAALSNQKNQLYPLPTITVTENTIIATNTSTGSTHTPYILIGGNSRLMIVESTDPEGYKSVVNIRLVEDGIAIETTNCREKPDQCERERQRAIQQMRTKYRAESSTNTTDNHNSDVSFAAESPGESKLDGLIPSLPRDDLSQPKWVYFKQNRDE